MHTKRPQSNDARSSKLRPQIHPVTAWNPALWLLILAGILLGLNVRAAMVPAQLRCEFAVNPLGVDSPQPRLFWKLESSTRGEHQSAYEILAASSAKNLAHDHGDLWDSGKTSSDETIHIPYAGKELKSSQQVFWKVRVWDQNGNASEWSRPARWTMGLLEPADWSAQWIGDKSPSVENLAATTSMRNHPLK